MEILLFILAVFFSFIISSIAHEFGHVLVGLKEGFKFHMLVAGPFGLKRDDKDKIKFYIEKNISFWGGVSATLPVSDDPGNFKSFGMVLLGGPLTSLLFGTIMLPFGIITDNMLLMLLGLMPISMGLACLLPLRNGAFYSDGGRWLRMHKNEDTMAVELALWNLTQAAILHGNCRNLKMEDIMVLIKSEDIRTKYMGHYYACRFYSDNKDDEKTLKEKEELDKLKEKVPKQMVSLFSIKF